MTKADVYRRKFLGASIAAVVAALAGCGSPDEDGGGSGGDGGGEETTEEPGGGYSLNRPDRTAGSHS